VYGNRRRVRGKRGKALGRLRSEYAERSFAHTCETGGARRSRLRELVNVAKRYLMYVAARNLGVMMRAIFGIGTPRSLQSGGRDLSVRESRGVEVDFDHPAHPLARLRDLCRLCQHRQRIRANPMRCMKKSLLQRAAR